MALHLKHHLQTSILIYEYAGYLNARERVVNGVAESILPDEQYCYGSIQAAFDFATKTQSFETRNIYLLGKSIGSGPAT
jgi:hypothetical protein